MNIKCLFALPIVISAVPILVFPKSAEANYCDLPSNIDPTGILCQTQRELDKSQKLIDEIEGGSDFAALAASHSKCPSGKDGGNLGTFGPGQMVKEFDDAVFNGEVGAVQGPVQTQFGFHILQVTERS